MRRRRGVAGFTLVEAVLVIVLLGILAGVLTPFIASTVEAYVATKGRSDLTARARVTLERLAREVRRAVPNTITELDGGDGIEFVTSKFGGRYMSRTDPFSNAYSNSSRFQKHANLSSLFILGTAYDNFSTDDFLVIYNDGTVGLDNASVQLQSVSTEDRDGDGVDEVQLLTFDTPHKWSMASQSQHFQIAGHTHEVGLVGNAIRWKRTAGITGMDGSAAYGSGDPVLVESDSLSVDFDYIPTSLTSNAVLKVTLNLTENGDSVTVSQEIHVRNVP